MAVVSVGAGYPVVVLQGGPGFSHHYLNAALLDHGADYRYVLPFAEDAGGRTVSRTFDEDVAAFVSAAAETSRLGPYSVLAHSWGGLVLCSALAEGAEGQAWLDNLDTAVIVSPLPTDRSALASVATRFRRSLPWIVRLKALYYALLARDPERMMHELLPYYGVRPPVPELRSLDLNLSHYFKGVRSVGAASPRLGKSAFKRLALITCGHDIVPAAAIQNLVEQASRTIHLASGSHFPMIEQPQRFAEAVVDLMPIGGKLP